MGPLFLSTPTGGGDDLQCPGFPPAHFHQQREHHFFEACIECLSGPDCANDGTLATRLTFRTSYCEGAGIVDLAGSNPSSVSKTSRDYLAEEPPASPPLW